MIHVGKVRKQLMEHQPVSLKFWKRNGEIVAANNVVCTSSYFKNDTVNLKFLTSDEFRKIRVLSIFEFNGEEVCI
ncbi:MAG: hypothetical protein QM503_03860 [Bacteroidota bacterium]